MKKDSKSESSANLRQKAEAVYKKNSSNSGSTPIGDQTLKLIHDLEVHKIELELQNEELMRLSAEFATEKEKYAELYDSAPSGYFTLSKNGEIIELNLCASQMLGKERTFLKNKMFGLYVCGDSKPAFSQYLDTVLSSKAIENCEVALQVNSNQPMYVNLSGTVTENGEQCLIILTDITSHKNAEISLTQLAADWQTTFDASNDMIWLLDKDQRVVRLNKVSERFCKRYASEIIGAHCWEIMHGTTEPISNCPFIRATKSHKREYSEHQIGEEWFRAAVDPIIDASGQYTGAVHIVTNITECRQAEVLLSDSFDRLLKIASRVPGVVYQYRLRPDGSSCFPFASEAINNIYRVTPDEVREDASKVFAVLHPDDYENIVASIQKSARELAPWQHEYRVKFDDGTVCWLFGNAIPQLEEDGSVLWHGFITNVTERKQLEEKLLESEQRLRRISESGMLGLFYWNDNGQITDANDKFLEMTGYTRNELEDGKIDWIKMTPPEFKYINDNALIELKTYGNIILPYEKEYIRKDGTRFPILFTSATIDEQRHQGVAFITDITKRKLAENALRLKNIVFDASIAGNSITGIDGFITDTNEAFLRIWGYASKEEVLNEPIAHFYNDPDDAIVIIKTLNEKDKWEGDYTARKKDGSTFIAHCMATTLKDNNGNLIGYQSSVIDITERIRLEASLQRHAERLQNLHKIDEAILSSVETPEEIIQKTLQHIRSLLSSQHASIGMIDFENEVLQLFSSNIKDESKNVAKKYQINNALRDLEILREKKMGVVENISLGSLPTDLQRILPEEGIMSCINIPLVVGEKLIGTMNLGWGDPRAFTPEELEIAGEVADEITIGIEQIRLRQAAKHYAKELENRVEERTSQLLVANKELEAFSYSVSHDLRAPLRHINGYISILSKHLQDLPEKEKHYLDTIADSARQMGVLIDDLLNFSRTGRKEMQLTTLDMNIVLQDAMQVIQHESFGRGIKWEVAELPQVVGDYSLLKLVWVNLLSNAVKFSRVNVATLIRSWFC